MADAKRASSHLPAYAKKRHRISLDCSDLRKLPYQGYSPTIFRGRATEADLEVTVKGQLENSNSRRQAQACGGADWGAGTALHSAKGLGGARQRTPARSILVK